RRPHGAQLERTAAAQSAVDPRARGGEFERSRSWPAAGAGAQSARGRPGDGERLMRLPLSIDLGRAAFAVVLAVLLYLVALSETNPEGRKELPGAVTVQPVNVPAGLVVVNQPPPVRLSARAPQSVLNRLRADSGFTATIDASTAHAGDND